MLFFKVNGEAELTPVDNLERMRVFMNIQYVVVQIGDDVTVLYDGDALVKVRVSTKYRNQLCGICGNFDGNKTNDFRTSNGTYVGKMNNGTLIGNSWVLPEDLEDDKRFAIN